jgi:peptide deformylase
MAIRKTVQAGNPIIRQKATAVTKIKSAATKALVQDMVDTMREHGLVGIAAPQIGKSLRVFVSEIRKTKNRRNVVPDELRVFINPKITAVSKTQESGWEGCGSVASGQLFAMVKRPSSVTVEAYGLDGELFTLKATGLLARIIQHEYDHLEGKLFVDIADMKTTMSREEYLKLRRAESAKKR